MQEQWVNITGIYSWAHLYSTFFYKAQGLLTHKTSPTTLRHKRVTDYIFNSINAIFGRLLHTPDGHVVTLAYWE
jgi:hypothetical protein